MTQLLLPLAPFSVKTAYSATHSLLAPKSRLACRVSVSSAIRSSPLHPRKVSPLTFIHLSCKIRRERSNNRPPQLSFTLTNSQRGVRLSLSRCTSLTKTLIKMSGIIRVWEKEAQLTNLTKLVILCSNSSSSTS